MPPIHMPFFFDVAMAIASMGQQNATSQENATGGRPRRSAAIPSMEATVSRTKGSSSTTRTRRPMMAKREPLSSVPGGPDPPHVGSITLGGDIGRANSSRHSGAAFKD
jgi:hypothetical protein